MRLPKRATRLAPKGVAMAMTAMKTMIGRPITTSGVREHGEAGPLEERSEGAQLLDRPEDALGVERQKERDSSSAKTKRKSGEARVGPALDRPVGLGRHAWPEASAEGLDPPGELGRHAPQASQLLVDAVEAFQDPPAGVVDGAEQPGHFVGRPPMERAGRPFALGRPDDRPVDELERCRPWCGR